jgi:methylglutaconyl-CoA hydratase
MTYQSIELEHEAHVAIVTLNRPQVRNAFDETGIAELMRVFQELGTNDGVRVIVLAANGPAFCAGADLNWMRKTAVFTPEENRADAEGLARMLHAIHTCPKPVIAKVQGDCYGGGVGLVAACDIAVASGTAHFALSEVKIGLTPSTIAPYVIRAMGERAARRYFLTGERFSAYEAKQIGFVHDAVLPEALDAKVKEIVNAIAMAGPNAVKEAKRLVRDVAGMPLSEDLIADTVQRIADIRASDEGKEGLQAFLDKRKPNWQGE